jgi:hypothetical protein
MADTDNAKLLLRQEYTLLNLVGPKDYDLAHQAVRQATRDLALKHQREITEYAIHLLEGGIKEGTDDSRN